MKENALWERIHDSFSNQSFLTLLGAELEQVEPGRVVISCENRPDLRQQQAFLHGGVITTLADVSCGYAALTCIPEGMEVLSVELKINFLRPGAVTKAIATAQVLKPGRRLVVTEATVTDEKGTVLAKMLSSMMAASKE